jgi:hypothetical protein
MRAQILHHDRFNLENDDEGEAHPGSTTPA